jgi:cyanosortase A-associated protein
MDIPPKLTGLRAKLVVATAIASGLVLLVSLARPQPKRPLLGQQPYQFPAALKVAGWQQLASQEIPAQADVPALAARRYQFSRGGQTLEAQVWYLRYVEGNVSRFLNVYAQIKSTLEQQPIHQPQVGHAGLLTLPDRVYLSSCINAQGPTTLTEAQFAQNRYEYDLKPVRILSWLLGQQDLMDRRCFFTVLSVMRSDSRQAANPDSDNPNSTDLNTSADQTLLKEFWPIWHQLLQPQFPPS